MTIRVNRLFSILMIIQWLIFLLLTTLNSQAFRFKEGLVAATLLVLPAIWVLGRCPQRLWMRYLLGLSQVGFSALFLWFADGRIEIQLHVFISLVVLAFYKDVPLLVLASSIVLTGYLLKGMGLGGAGETAIQWRWFELMGWVFVESFILTLGIRHLNREFWKIAKAQHILQSSNEEVLKASSIKSHFLSRMSHEIRTPLNSIIGFTDILKETQLDKEQKGFVSTIHRCSEALLHIINDVLDLQKIESGLLQIDRHRFDIHELHEDIYKMFASQCAERGLKLQILLDERTPHFVEGDSHRLRQVLTNLVGNAVKFTDKGSITVEVRRDIGTQTYHWKIIDTGRGINPNNIPKLFRGFYQEDASVSRRFGGSGLGLMISKNLVELMGGSIAVESRQGVGTTFFFSLPIQEAYTEASE